MKKSNLKFRYRILLVMLPLAVIPLVMMIVVASFQISSHLKKQNIFFYQSVLEQISGKVDFIFTQYGMTFEDITSTDNFVKLIDAPPFKSKIEEYAFMKEVLGERAVETRGFTIRKIAFSRIEGEFSVIQVNRSSLLDNKEYKTWQFSQLLVNKDVGKLLTDPLYLYAKENKKRLVLGKTSNNVLHGFEADTKSVFIYPYYKEDADFFNDFLLVIVEKNFINRIFEDVEPIQYGTLYMIDPVGNIISTNHPSESDYYQYDDTKKRYKLGDDMANDPGENMTFFDYSLLNTDPEILQTNHVKNVLKELTEGNFDITKTSGREIRYRGKDYVLSASIASKSDIKLVYFHPVNQIVKPIYKIISIIVIFALFLIVIIVAISTFFSKTITNPIKDLAGASQTISKGDYKIEIETKSFSGELLDLGLSFNKMAKEINTYKEDLEELVKIRTQKLYEANKKMKDDLVMAQKIQDSLIPKIFPKSDVLKMSGLYMPMENLGGDLYDVIKISETKIAIMILDVCGHGVAAALITTMAKALFNTYSVKGLSCKDIVTNVNRELYNIVGDSGNYLTAFYGILDLTTQTLEYTNAAHTIIYILKKNGSIVELNTNSTLIGVFDGVEFESSTIKLDEFDKIVLYTDGIPESKDHMNNLFGYEKFRDLLLANKDLNSKDFIKKIIESVREYRDDRPQDDDITLLIVEVLPDISKNLKINIEILSDTLFIDINSIDNDKLKEYATHFMEALNYLENQNYQKIVDILTPIRNVFNRKIDNFKIELLLGFALFKIDDLSSARECWYKALQYNPNNKDVKLYLEVIDEIYKYD